MGRDRGPLGLLGEVIRTVRHIEDEDARRPREGGSGVLGDLEALGCARLSPIREAETN